MTKYGQKFSFGAITPGSNFYQWKRLPGTMLSTSENLRSKGVGYHMTKYGQKYNFGSIDPFKCTNQELHTFRYGILSIKKIVMELHSTFWKF